MAFRSDIIPSYLFNAYNTLRKSNLVCSRNATPENMKVFEDTLNRTIPGNDVAKGLRIMAYKLYIATSKTHAFQNLLNDNRHDLRPFILWCHPRAITSHFGIDDLVFIRHDRQDEKYHVLLIDQSKPKKVMKFHKDATFSGMKRYAKKPKAEYKAADPDLLKQIERDQQLIAEQIKNDLLGFGQDEIEQGNDANGDEVGDEVGNAVPADPNQNEPQVNKTDEAADE